MTRALATGAPLCVTTPVTLLPPPDRDEQPAERAHPTTSASRIRYRMASDPVRRNRHVAAAKASAGATSGRRSVVAADHLTALRSSQSPEDEVIDPVANALDRPVAEHE